MPVLKNDKHEAFAQALASGSNATAAHKAAGFSGKRSAASSLKHRSDILERFRELVETKSTIVAKAEERAIERFIEKRAITKEAVLGELAKIGFANMADYMKVGADGDPYLDFSAITRDQAAALCELTVEDFKDGRGEEAREVRRVKFKLADKKGALVDLGKHLGLFIERHEHGSPGDFERLSDDELMKVLVLEAQEIGVPMPVLALNGRGNGKTH